MPLSKAKNRERMKQKRVVQPIVVTKEWMAKARATLDNSTEVLVVQPSDEYILGAIKYLDDVPVQPEMVEVIEEWTPDKHTLSIDGDVQPIPNCPDGRYRDA